MRFREEKEVSEAEKKAEQSSNPPKARIVPISWGPIAPVYHPSE
jgi:hypothetical protein